MIADLSILMANYNGMPYLEEAIASIDKSTVQPKEFLLIDDGSTDDSLHFIESLPQKNYKVRLIRNNHGGQPSALNKGLEVAATAFVMRMDADDLLEPKKIEKQLACFDENPDVFIIGTNALYIDATSGALIGESNFLPDYAGILNRYRQGGYGLLDGTTMFRNPNTLSECRYNESVGVGNEITFHLDIVVKNNKKAMNLQEPLYRVRIHSSSLSVRNTLAQVKAKHQIKRTYFSLCESWFEGIIIAHDFATLYLWKKALLSRKQSYYKYLFYAFLTAFLQPSRVFYRLKHLFMPKSLRQYTKCLNSSL